jgi:site-specific DNA-methyltransferase (adenine-specific)
MSNLPAPDWQSDDGSVSLYCADCLTILPLLPAGSVDCIVTDPPYSSGGMVRGDRMQSTRTKYQQSDVKTEHAVFTGDNRDQRGWVAWMTLWLLYAMRGTKPGAMACLFTDWRQLPSTTDAIQAGGWVWRGIAPWDKINARPQPNRLKAQAEFVVWGTNGPRNYSTEGATYHDGVFRVLPPIGDDREHSTQKPVELMEKLVCIAGHGETVLDPFMGSCSTGVACVRTGRRFIGIEMDRGYFDISVRRIQAAIDDGALFADVKPKQEQMTLDGLGDA